MYEPYYGLSGKPFQLSPDPTFYYESPVHRRAYAYLEYGLYQREGFIVITGEVGAGKTTLVRNLLAHLDQKQVVAGHLVSTSLDADDLLRAAATALGVQDPPADKASLLLQMEKFLRRQDAEKRQVLLVVDEAQNLTPKAIEELRMLSNFQAGDRALLQSFLVGQPELRETLQRQELQQFRQRIIASYHLGALDASETRSYIKHRLRHVGWKGDPSLDDLAYDAIFALTAGIPRRINLVCNRLLLAGFLNGQHRLGAADVEIVAKELKEELGIIAQREADSDQVERRPKVAARSDAVRDADASRELSPKDTGSEPGAGHGLAQRVARIELILAHSYTVLKRLLQAAERDAPQRDA